MPVIRAAIEAVKAYSGRVSTVIKIDDRAGVSDGLTAKVATVERYLAEGEAAPRRRCAGVERREVVRRAAGRPPVPVRAGPAAARRRLPVSPRRSAASCARRSPAVRCDRSGRWCSC